MGEERVGHEGEPLDGVTVGGDDGGCVAVAFDDELVEVGGVGVVEAAEGEVIENEQVDTDQLAEFGVATVVEPGGAEALEELVGPFEPDRVPAADGGVAEGGGDERLADADRAEDQGVVGVVDEAE